MDNHGIRYYDPEVGRYISRDPIGYKDGMNVYLYVHGNPLNHIDPTGLSDEDLKLNWHHELPQEVFNKKLIAQNPGLKSLDIDDAKYGWIGDENAHKAVHSPEGKHAGRNPEGGLDGRKWNDDWKAWIAKQEEGSITREGVEQQLSLMEKDYSGIFKQGKLARELKNPLSYGAWKQNSAVYAKNLEAFKTAVGERALALDSGLARTVGGAVRIGGEIVSKSLALVAVGFAVSDYAHGSEIDGISGGIREAARGFVMAPEIESAMKSAAATYRHGVENTFGASIKNEVQQINNLLNETGQ